MIKYLFLLLFPVLASAQPNCNVFLYEKDTAMYNACQSVEEVPYYQYARGYQEQFDRALALCPRFSYAYQCKSVAYLKSGDFLTWKLLIDKAVQYDTFSCLGYRGWCRYQFFRDYNGAIADIEYLERHYKTIDIGYSAGGDYHLLTTKAMCYSALGEKQKAIALYERLLLDTLFSPGPFDYYQLAVTYFQVADYANAQKYLDLQSQTNELAECRYYKAKIAKLKGDLPLYHSEKAEALRLYKIPGRAIYDPYTEHLNKVFLTTIEAE